MRADVSKWLGIAVKLPIVWLKQAILQVVLQSEWLLEAGIGMEWWFRATRAPSNNIAVTINTSNLFLMPEVIVVRLYHIKIIYCQLWSLANGCRET